MHGEKLSPGRTMRRRLVSPPPFSLVAGCMAGLLLLSATELHAQSAYVSNQGVGTVQNILNGVAGTSINVGTMPAEIVFAQTANGPRLYVANSGSNTVSVINPSTNMTSGAAISVGSKPEGMAVSPDGGTVYVVNRGNGTTNGTVTFINTSTNAAGPSVTVQRDPRDAATTEDGALVYVTNFNDDSVSIINTQVQPPSVTNVFLKLLCRPVGISIVDTAAGEYAYIACQNTVFGGLFILDTSNNTMVNTIPVGTSPTGVARTHSGDRVFVSNQSSASVSVVSTVSNSVTGTVGVGSTPFGLEVDPSDTLLYVANFGNGTVTPVNLTTVPPTAGTNIFVGMNPRDVAFVGGAPATATPTPTSTPIPTSTPTPTATRTVTPTFTATVTPSPTATATGTDTPSPTSTVTPSITNTPTSTHTSTATATDTATASATPTATNADTATSTPTETATATPVDTATNTATATAVDTATVTPTAVDTATSTPTATDTATPMGSPTDTSTPLPTATSTETPIPTATSTETPIPTATDTVTATATATATPITDPDFHFTMPFEGQMLPAGTVAFQLVLPEDALTITLEIDLDGAPVLTFGITGGTVNGFLPDVVGGQHTLNALVTLERGGGTEAQTDVTFEVAGPTATSTPTTTPTETPTQTNTPAEDTETPTITATATITGTPTGTATATITPTATATATPITDPNFFFVQPADNEEVPEGDVDVQIALPVDYIPSSLEVFLDDAPVDGIEDGPGSTANGTIPDVETGMHHLTATILVDRGGEISAATAVNFIAVGAGTATATVTSTVTPTATATPEEGTATVTPTATNTVEGTATDTPTVTPTVTETPTTEGTATNTPTPTLSPNETATSTPTATPTATAISDPDFRFLQPGGGASLPPGDVAVEIALPADSDPETLEVFLDGVPVSGIEGVAGDTASGTIPNVGVGTHLLEAEILVTEGEDQVRAATSVQFEVAEPTSTPTATETATPQDTPTVTPTFADTATATATATRTSTATVTPTSPPTGTSTPTATRTVTPTVTPTENVTNTPTRTPTRALTPTPTPTSTETEATSTPTNRPSFTPTSTPRRSGVDGGCAIGAESGESNPFSAVLLLATPAFVLWQRRRAQRPRRRS